jgi:hypothetical protein
MTTQWPNTALEPTADPRFSLSGSVGFAVRRFGGGSAFVRYAASERHVVIPTQFAFAAPHYGADAV